VDRILKLIFGEDEELVEEYTLMILRYLKLQIPIDCTKEQPVDELSISSPHLMALLLDDYKKKRMGLEEILPELSQSKRGT
jgi:hypothetical protein